MGAEKILIDNGLLAEPAKIVIAAERFRSTFNMDPWTRGKIEFESQEVVKAVYRSAIRVTDVIFFGAQIAQVPDRRSFGSYSKRCATYSISQKPAKLVLTCATDYDPEDLEHHNPFDSGSDDEEDLADSDDAREHYMPVG